MRKDGLCSKCKQDKAGSSGYCRVCTNANALARYYKNKKIFPPIINLKDVYEGVLYTERWLPVIGYETEYMISDFGRLKRIKSTKKRIGWHDLNLQEKLINPSKDKMGYLFTYLSNNGLREKVLIHRLVAVHFLKNPLNKPEVNHKKGIKSDNRSLELEWVTHKENMEHSAVNGFHKKGESHPRCLLRECQVIEIYKSNKSERALSKEYNVSRSTINCIKTGKSWKYLKLTK